MGKICAIHQPNFLPWLGFFYKISKADTFIVLDNVEISVSSAKAITHRTKIKTQNGIQYLSIPLLQTNSKLIKDIQIDTNQSWKRKHLKTIYFAYKKAIGFDYIYPEIEQFYAIETVSLSEFNLKSIKFVMQLMEIRNELILASSLNNISSERNQRIIDLCKTVDANIYLSGFGAKKYHDELLFQHQNIKVLYTDFEHPVYIQQHGAFIEGLSAIDFLFNKEWR